ncbi:MAG: radical SAM protein [bacterium]
MKIQLIHLNLLNRKRIVNRNFAGEQPCLPLLYLAAGLQIDGHEVEYIEAVAGKPETYMPQFAISQPDCVGFTSYAANWKHNTDAIGAMRASRPKTTFIVGGFHASHNTESILHNDSAPDVVFAGEAEESIREWAKIFDYRSSWINVAGLYIKQDREIVFTGERRPPTDLDKLPFPAWELVDPFRYRPAPGYSSRKPHASIVGSRGANNGLNCSTLPSETRLRSAEHILEEINWLNRYHNVKDIYFIDESILYFPERTQGICESVISRKIDLTWVANTSVAEVKPEILKLMHRAGCKQLLFRLGSGVQKNLDTLGKEFTIEQSRSAVRMTNDTKILAHGVFTLGIPGETFDEAIRTIEFARSLNLRHSTFEYFTPYPGTAIYEKLIESNSGLILPDSSFDTETPSFIPKDMTIENMINLKISSRKRFHIK